MRLPPPPLANSYWVERGRLLAGEHPCAGGQQAAYQRRVQLLLAAGVRTFIDLTHEGEMPGYEAWLPGPVAVHRLPIADHSVPDSTAHMREIQRTLARSLEKEGAVYVHCRAGYGRTGTAIGCYLRECGQTPEAALAELNRLWQQSAHVQYWPQVPETGAQRQYILDWKAEVRRARAG